MEPSLPNPDVFAGVAVAVLFGIVIWDAFWLTRQRLDRTHPWRVAKRWLCLGKRRGTGSDSSMG